MQRQAATARQAVDLAGDELLAGAVLAEDQDVGVGRRGALDQVADPLQRRRLADQRRFDRRHELGRPAALDARIDLARAERGGAAHRRRQPLVAPRLGDHGRIGVLVHDPREIIEAFAPVGRRALEIEVEQDRVGRFALEQRQQLGRRLQRLDPLELVAQRKPRGEGDIGIVVDDHGKVE